MKFLFNKIIELSLVATHTKHEQLVLGIINAIDAKMLKKGDRLPSINVMVEELGFARKTIVKAYEELKSRGIVESKNFKGYYISNSNTEVKLKVALLLFAFHSFQEDFYNTFRKELGKRYHIDVFFHHNNFEIFKNIVATISGKYGMYVVAPIQTAESIKILKTFTPEKLLIIDRYIKMPEGYSYITQEFENTTYTNLVALLPQIKKHEKFILFYQDDLDFPEGIKNAFLKFIDEYQINGVVEKKYKPKSVVKGVLYFFISDNYLWELLRDCKNTGIELGQDIGVLAHNDNTIKEIIFGGITTISTDFKQMAITSANYVKNTALNQIVIPTEIKRRNSL
jgi:DNA-binding transcriptional regulator YhcF (GntR family)